MSLDRDTIEARLTRADRARLFRSLGCDLGEGDSGTDGWVHGLHLPPALGRDQNPSFCINLETGACKDFGSDYSADLYKLVQDVRRCTFPEALEWMAGELRMSPAPAKPTWSPFRDGHRTVFPYHAEDGSELFQVVRFDVKEGHPAYPDKTFLQRYRDPEHPNAKRDGYVWRAPDRLVPYGLPAVLEAARAGRVVFVGEGEKVVHALRGMGFVATCNPGGAGKWRPEFSAYLEGAHVVILPDKDEQGRCHAEDVARHTHSVAASVRIVELPGLHPRGDAADWKEAGHTADELRALVSVAPTWTPPPAPSADATPEGEEPVSKESGQGKGPTQLEELLEVASGCRLFQGDDGEAYALMPGGTTYPVRSRLFEMWLRERFFEAAQKRRAESNGKGGALAPGAEAVSAALNSIEAQARFSPDMPGRYAVRLRTAGLYGDGGHLEAIFIDLADGRFVEVRAGTWRVVDEAPVFFLRTQAQHPLPEPDPDGRLADLLPFLRTETEAEQTFVLAWLVYAFHPAGPYPMLVLHGTAGSGKSTQARLLRSLTDPVAAPLRRPPKTSEDLFVWAKHNAVVALENVSEVSDRLSDDLCSICTGASFAARTLYTNADETAFTFKRPILVNGIDEFVTRGDLLSRTLRVSLRTISGEERRTEAELRRAMEGLRPRVFGGICHALAEALKRPGHQAPRLPRMADFANFIDAAAPAFPPELPPLIDALAGLHEEMVRERAEESGLVTAFLAALQQSEGAALEGDLTTWLETLHRLRKAGTAWPPNAQAFRSELRRAVPLLEQLGVRVERTDRQDPVTRRVLYRLTLHPGRDPSHPSILRHGERNGLYAAERADSAPKDARRITGGSEGARLHPSPHPSGENGRSEASRGVSEGSKDLKDAIPTGEGNAPGARLRLSDGRLATLVSDRGNVLIVEPDGGERTTVPTESATSVAAPDTQQAA